MTKARYLNLLETGELARRVAASQAHYAACVLCGWRCGADRYQAVGPCRTGVIASVATAYRHMGEETPLVQGGGSGAIFFTNCDLRCQFCQTAKWNIKGSGRPITAAQLAGLMLRLQAEGAVNINLVTPTHVLPQILEALLIAASDGLILPLVWNSGGHDTVEALHLLDGVVDIYLPDMKYATNDLGRRMSGVHRYAEVNRTAIMEMARQVGSLKMTVQGRAVSGVLVRHLVMPGHLENTRQALGWLVAHLGPQTYLSLMDQYRPAYRAFARTDIGRAIRPEEYQQAYETARSMGFQRIDGHLLTAE